jgi:hypothetical protein
MERWYLKGGPDQWLRTIKILLDHGAKLNKKDGQYWADHYGGVPKGDTMSAGFSRERETQ